MQTIFLENLYFIVLWMRTRLQVYTTELRTNRIELRTYRSERRYSSYRSSASINDHENRLIKFSGWCWRRQNRTWQNSLIKNKNTSWQNGSPDETSMKDFFSQSIKKCYHGYGTTGSLWLKLTLPNMQVVERKQLLFIMDLRWSH